MRAALSYPAFRLVWTGSLLSNVGTWMQNIALPAYIRVRTGSAGLVGVMLFAQLGPMLLLSIPGGVLAARYSRRRIMIISNSAQLIGSVVLAGLVWRRVGFLPLFAANLAIGIANAFSAPAFQSSIPLLVDRRDLGGAISLNSTQLNGSRVIGPVLSAGLSAIGVGLPGLFLINAATYLFMIFALLKVRFPPIVGGVAAPGWRQLTTGVRIARSRFVVGRMLLSMTALSFFTLVYVGQFSSVAELNFGIDPLGATYKWLYAIWGFGALLGGLASGTVLARVDKVGVIRPATLSMAVSIAVFAAMSSKLAAFPVVFVVGICYFLTTTAMTTVFQQSLADHERPYAMSLWFMSFGGTVPLGNLAFGPVIDHIGARPVMYMGAAVAVVVAFATDFTRARREVA